MPGQHNPLQAETPHLFHFNPNPRTITWERLEAQRLKSLGISNRYSRHFTMVMRNDHRDSSMGSTGSGSYRSQPSSLGYGVPVAMVQATQTDGGVAVSNSIAPFSTSAKPTCGYFFSRSTDNKKQKFGIPPSDLVKWRTH